MKHPRTAYVVFVIDAGDGCESVGVDIAAAKLLTSIDVFRRALRKLATIVVHDYSDGWSSRSDARVTQLWSWRAVRRASRIERSFQRRQRLWDDVDDVGAPKGSAPRTSRDVDADAAPPPARAGARRILDGAQ